jgi:hypothetical protein
MSETRFLGGMPIFGVRQGNDAFGGVLVTR